ncbi:MAG TPA: cytochrome c biogenesis protein ResB [Pontiella sp.]
MFFDSNILTKGLKGIASPYLTLIVVAFLIVLSLIGAIVPQQGVLEQTSIYEWKQQHGTATRLLLPINGFAIFHSPAFLICLGVLFLNTLSCTLVSVLNDGLFSEKTLASQTRRLGFIILHLSILVCIFGGFVSAGFRMSGHLIVTEGQSIKDQHHVYPKLVEGPLRKELYNRFSLELLDAQIDIEKEWFPVKQEASVLLTHPPSKVQATIGFNYPFKFNNTIFTLREIGYAPQIIIKSQSRRIPPLNTFFSLQVWGFNEDREHYDFLPLPSGGTRLVITFYPSYEIRDGEIIKTSEDLNNPALLIYEEFNDGKQTPKQLLPQGETATINGLDIQFGELRQWAAFQVVQDPGYIIVCISFWFSIIALILRYSPDILDWIKESKSHGTS